MIKDLKWTYPTTARITEVKTGKRLIALTTKLYPVGIYLCIEGPRGEIRRPFVFTPEQVIKVMKDFNTDNLMEGLSVEFGKPITITMTNDGLYVEQKS